MTDQQIKDFNKRCVDFLGIKYEERTVDTDIDPVFSKPARQLVFNIGNKKYTLNNLKFHSDWNWIMDVVIKIEMLNIELPERFKKGFLKNSTHGNVIIDTSYDNRPEFNGWSSSVSIELSHPFIYDSLNYDESRFETKIEATVHAIDKFLIWYENPLV